MLQLHKIKKQYSTGELTQDALKEVSLNFRDNEFVSILGPSGSGKTTLLNIIGGLDRYDTGDLIINGISTKKYTDKNWDAYRNHTIGFVFQSYNLIGHQSVLANVELALTISGISRKERKKRAIEALEEVGLKEHLHKKPNQLSGGQMQRVAIARALVNNPGIVLADEPTGALDSETSVQVMELLKKVAQNRLVIMVTHNPELGKQYATRTIQLRDGSIIADSDPYEVPDGTLPAPIHQKMGKASMSFMTSLSLSFNNLRTKKARTILTAFAGSIGIIGIAMILSFSNGVTTYINDIQKETMSSYPITIDAEAIDMKSLMGNAQEQQLTDVTTDKKAVYSDSLALIQENSVITSIAKNNLTEFKAYLEENANEIDSLLGVNGIIYSYDVPFDAYGIDSKGTITQVKGDTSEESGSERPVEYVQMQMMQQISSSMGEASNDYFSELIPGKNGALVSQVTMDSYDILAGNWPESGEQVMIVLDENHRVPTTLLYALGLISAEEYHQMLDDCVKDKEFVPKEYEFSYQELLGKEFYLYTGSDRYKKNDKGFYQKIDLMTYSTEKVKESSITVKIAGVICPREDCANATIATPVAYTHALTDQLITHATNSEIVKEQQNQKEVNVINGVAFAPKSDEDKIAIAYDYLSKMEISKKADFMRELLSASTESEATAQMEQMNELQLAQMLDQYLENPDDQMLLMFYENSITTGSYEENMKAFGYVNKEAPSSISIYPGSFEDKEALSDLITAYNQEATEENQVIYNDFVGMMTSSMTTIINVISYVLIAFVGVSLVVSSIMIGIITYISVLERTKEIGVLRAIGASKHNISQVFNAETFIIGLLSGGIGLGMCNLLLIPVNKLLSVLIKDATVTAVLPIKAAAILLVLSVILTMLGGMIPARKAAKKDPVTALRSE